MKLSVRVRYRIPSVPQSHPLILMSCTEITVASSHQIHIVYNCPHNSSLIIHQWWMMMNDDEWWMMMSNEWWWVMNDDEWWMMMSWKISDLWGWRLVEADDLQITIMILNIIWFVGIFSNWINYWLKFHYNIFHLYANKRVQIKWYFFLYRL